MSTLKTLKILFANFQIDNIMMYQYSNNLLILEIILLANKLLLTYYLNYSSLNAKLIDCNTINSTVTILSGIKRYKEKNDFCSDRKEGL